jgi:hypothetical protein
MPWPAEKRVGTMTPHIPRVKESQPRAQPDYERLKGRRSDAESANRQIDDDLYLRRAARIGAKDQLFDLICHAFVINSVARARHRNRGRPPNRAVAA